MEKQKIGDDVISVIHKTYPEIPMMWLLFGEGEKPKFCASDQACENLLFPHDSPNPVENEILKGVESRSIAQNMPIVNQLPQEKKISKIVVFFTDNSFEEYYLKNSLKRLCFYPSRAWLCFEGGIS